MDFVGKTICLLGALTVLFGMLLVVIPLFRLRRKDGLIAIALGCGLAMLGPQLSPELRANAAAANKKEQSVAAASTAPVAAPQPAKLTKKQMLANLSINSLLWEKNGFGTVMVATFMVKNDNPVKVKDVRVTCQLAANSGTVIDTATRTVYEIIDQKSYIYVHGMNMGFIHSATSQSNCTVTDFAVG